MNLISVAHSKIIIAKIVDEHRRSVPILLSVSLWKSISKLWVWPRQVPTSTPARRTAYALWLAGCRSKLKRQRRIGRGTGRGDVFCCIALCVCIYIGGGCCCCCAMVVTYLYDRLVRYGCWVIALIKFYSHLANGFAVRKQEAEIYSMERLAEAEGRSRLTGKRSNREWMEKRIHFFFVVFALSLKIDRGCRSYSDGRIRGSRTYT